ncbi:hypothetical protein L226DRAFT_568624 [Lentinus tigrinus ALCF2SS1-7]|nr:hypothetical protein L226DRAFT_568624 [Lentinus tigrinus ALCF2SS1-7]
MASRLARRAFANSVRPAARVSAPVGRRFASTTAGHVAKESSDMPWIIGSALVFGPVIAYLLTPTAKSKASHAAEHKHAKAGISAVPNEVDAPAPKSDVDASATQAIVSDSPKDAQAAEEASFSDSAVSSEDGKVHGSPELTDSEGTTVSAEEVDASMKQAFDANLPVDAQRAEEGEDKYASGAPGQTEEAETDHEQKEKPGRAHTGTLQTDDHSGPTNLGDARQASTSKQAPKQASQD